MLTMAGAGTPGLAPEQDKVRSVALSAKPSLRKICVPGAGNT